MNTIPIKPVNVDGVYVGLFAVQVNTETKFNKVYGIIAKARYSAQPILKDCFEFFLKHKSDFCFRIEIGCSSGYAIKKYYEEENIPVITYKQFMKEQK